MSSSACWLGLSGAIPFVVLASLGAVEWHVGISDVTFALRGYGAVILSFLGGVHWGVVIHNEPREVMNDKKDAIDLGLAVVPSLIGWMGLLVDQMWGICILILGFVMVLFMDLRIVRRGLIPVWYPYLRILLTAIVVLSLISVLIFGT